MAAIRTEPTPAATAAQEREWGFEKGDTIVPGRTVVRLLGGGERYETYLAWDDSLLALVVVKAVRPHLVEDSRALRGLLDEVALLERLRHPVIVRSFDASPGGPTPHVVLEHLEGPRLSTLVRRYGPLASEQLLPLGLQLCSAAHYLAGLGIVHLDVKPSNVIMGAPARLIDLSVAATVDELADARRGPGTDAYMSPEQCDPRGRGPITGAADVWGIGATLHHAATGEPPFATVAEDRRAIPATADASRAAPRAGASCPSQAARDMPRARSSCASLSCCARRRARASRRRPAEAAAPRSVPHPDAVASTRRIGAWSFAR